MVNEIRIARIHLFHTTSITFGAILLAIGILFFSLEFSWLQLATTVMSESQIMKIDKGIFLDWSLLSGISGVLIIIVSTVVSDHFIRKS